MSIIEKSTLIDEDENRKFISIVANKSKILYFTVARLYQVCNNEWSHMHTGLLALTKDNNKKKYLLEMYSMDNLSKPWEHIIPINFSYNVSKKQIHTFKINDAPFLLSFANFEESSKFSNEVQKLQKTRRDQKNLKKNESEPATFYPSITDSINENKHTVKQPVITQGTKIKGGKINKSDISNPTNFKHLDHMGLNDHFFENPEDENLKSFLKKNNMENLLDNDESKRAIYEFIDQQGGLEKLGNEMKQQREQQQQFQMRKAPPVPQKIPPPPPDRSHNAAPVNHSNKPHPPGMMAPPVPQSGMKTGHQPSSGAAPPPPPPPPPPPAPAPPPPVNFVAKPTSHVSAPPPPAGKGGLLAEIEKFDAKKLKARSQTDAEEAAPPAPAVGGSLLDSLAQFLVQRKTLWTGTSDSEASDDGEDEDWKD